MSTHVEAFRLSTDTGDSLVACHRALLSAEWEEQASDRVEVQLMVGDGGGSLGIGIALTIFSLVPPARRLIDRFTTMSEQAPPGPAGTNAEINAVYKKSWIVRISLRERGPFGTDVTLSGADLGSPWGGPLRSGLRDLRRSIESQSGSLTACQPPTT